MTTFAILDLLDVLVRKSPLVADRSSGRTRFAMLETIRQFAEEQLVARGEASDSGRPLPVLRRARSRHPGPVGQPPSARPTTGSLPSSRNWRTAFRWAAD